MGAGDDELEHAAIRAPASADNDKAARRMNTSQVKADPTVRLDMTRIHAAAQPLPH
jgi:hypothetical protein